MKKKGFTLIELMITLALFSLFAGFLYNAYFTQIKENNSFNSKIDLKYNGDKAMNLITDELRSNVTMPNENRITEIKSNISGLCEGITSIDILPGIAGEEDSIIIIIDLQSKNDRYTVTSAVNINK